VVYMSIDYVAGALGPSAVMIFEFPYDKEVGWVVRGFWVYGVSWDRSSC